MAGATRGDVDNFGLAMELYSKDIHIQQNVQNSFYNFLEKADSSDVNFDGKQFNIAVMAQFNESYAAINSNERLPEADIHKSVFAKFKPKLTYSTLEAETFAATRGHNGGLVGGKYLDQYMKATLLSFLSNRDFDSIGNGRGYRATIATAVAGASSFTVDFATRLRPGMKLDWYDSTLTTKRGSIKIAFKGVDWANRTPYIDSTFGTGAVPTGAAADDVLAVYGSLGAGEPTDGRHPTGFARAADSSVSLGELSPSDYAWWLPTNVNAGGANPNESLLQQYWDMFQIISSAFPDRMSFNPTWKRGYLAQFLSLRRFTSNSYDTGASSLTWSPVMMGEQDKKRKPPEVRMLESKDMDPTETFIWNSKAVLIATDYASAPHLADEDGNEFRMRTGYDAMAAFYRFWWNIVYPQRNAIGRIYNWAPGSGTV
jgi:hypothetical protein